MDIHKILKPEFGNSEETVAIRLDNLMATYRLMANTANDEVLRRIAAVKHDALYDAATKAEIPFFPDYTVNFPDEKPLEDLRATINETQGVRASLQNGRVQQSLSALPESAEKHYLSAIVQLSINNDLAACRAAAVELGKAVALDGTNEAYNLLLMALEREIGAYEARQQAARQKLLDEQTAIEQNREAAQRRRDNIDTTKAIFKYSLIVGAILFVVVMFVSCFV